VLFQEVWGMLSQLVVGLRDMHSVGLIHRDMKLENIFLMEDGRVKIGMLLFRYVSFLLLMIWFGFGFEGTWDWRSKLRVRRSFCSRMQGRGLPRSSFLFIECVSETT
jgi:hypothetical protein